MLEYNASGFIDIDRWGYPILCKKKGDKNDSINLIENIKEFILKNSDIGSYEEKNSIMGGEIHTIPNCNILIWFTRGKKTIEEAQASMNAFLYGGEYSVDVDYDGYSEFTITDYDLNKFTIGGHNLRRIFENKRGKYCNFKMEAYKPVGGLTCSNVYEMKKEITLPSRERVSLGALLEVVGDLADGHSIRINNKAIAEYLKKEGLIQRDGNSYSSVSAVNEEQMEEFYNQIEQMVWNYED